MARISSSTRTAFGWWLLVAIAALLLLLASGMAAAIVDSRDLTLGLGRAAARHLAERWLELASGGAVLAVALLLGVQSLRGRRAVGRVAAAAIVLFVARLLLAAGVPSLHPLVDTTSVMVNLAALALTGGVIGAGALLQRLATRLFPPLAVRAGGLVVVLAVPLLALLVRATTAPDPSAPNIVVVVVDCLRQDHLRAYAPQAQPLPHIDRFAAGADRWARAWSPSSWTKPAVASLLTGQAPTEHGVLAPRAPLGAGLRTLADDLRNQGYETVMINGGNTFLDRAFGVPRSFDTYVLVHEVAGAKAVLDRFVERPVDPGQPFFAYLHLMDAHLPYRHPPDPAFDPRQGLQMPAPLPVNLDLRTLRRATLEGTLTAADQHLVRHLYAVQLQHIDRAFGRLLNHLAQQGLEHNTVVVLTSDHGEEFWEHGGFEHGHALYNEVVQIPLLIRLPGNGARVHESVASLTDLRPTLGALAGVGDLHTTGQGVDLLGTNAAKQRGITLSSTLYGPRLGGWTDGSLKWIAPDADGTDGWRYAGPQVTAPVLFDLAADPGEQIDRYAQRATDARRIADAYAASGRVRTNDDDEVVLDEALRLQLRSLGYAQ